MMSWDPFLGIDARSRSNRGIYWANRRHLSFALLFRSREEVKIGEVPGPTKKGEYKPVGGQARP
jgi:hypothetical protein